MDTTKLESAYEALVQAAGATGLGAPADGEWDADTVLAHVVASSRMVAAASAELLEGRIPVVDNRPTQSGHYLEAIVRSAASRVELLATMRSSGRELVILASWLDEKQIATSVPAIIVDAGRIRVQRPVPFSTLLEPSHVRGHLEQLQGLRA